MTRACFPAKRAGRHHRAEAASPPPRASLIISGCRLRGRTGTVPLRTGGGRNGRNRHQQPDPQLALRPAGGVFRARTERPDRGWLTGRRPSESFIPIPVARRGRGEQQTLDFDVTGERRERNALINDIRREVERWRAVSTGGVTPITRKLLQHWAADPPTARTGVLLPARGGRDGDLPDRGRGPARHADSGAGSSPRTTLTTTGCPRVGAEDGDRHGQDRRDGDADRLADAQQGACRRKTPASPTGSSSSPPGSRSAIGSACCCPRTRTTTTASATSSRRSMGGLLHAQIAITNYHAFQLKDAKEIQGVAKNTRKLLLAGDRKRRPVQGDAARHGAAASCATSASDKQQIMVLNDEAHHCYQDRPLQAARKPTRRSRSATSRPASGSGACRRSAQHVGDQAVYDLSATPFYLKGPATTRATSSRGRSATSR